MATISDLHTSISDMSDEDLFYHIREIRALRRELPVKTVKKPGKKKGKTGKKKQISIEDHLKTMGDVARRELLTKLMQKRKETKNE